MVENLKKYKNVLLHYQNNINMADLSKYVFT